MRRHVFFFIGWMFVFGVEYSNISLVEERMRERIAHVEESTIFENALTERVMRLDLHKRKYYSDFRGDIEFLEWLSLEERKVEELRMHLKLQRGS
ncbi:MAG: hypothetical protein COV07_03300 [Candidatus Vogelbacteria bacterium CG10_big_fil_rev_8_21_14_0_10_45_14]|uniref:Uncharacterized protein n=1 Tax=Candidatus Vogelbacteria bacterium CG10_big_fil_rev_8_21_14_0_10_45_14 TaxID=1975042 RepID=A0A2H0RLF4_9BACT|nr:MAG: hypothetical protein COV07_03300 [Candidatus Vogelbacteria bacterium CG10_big_fil_rev_8_21_14_0_10_45_14]